MWIDLISASSGQVEFNPPASVEAISAAERALGGTLPEELRSLLLEANGVSDEYGCEFIWAAEEIVKRNREMRENLDFRNLYMPFDPLLFIGDSGGGDLFAFVAVPKRPDVFVWQHESDSRRWIANDLRDYIARYLAAGGEDWYAS
ncbi:SMI1/KNR4 family protein [Streptomyces sp. p1417]|uniref:SMI1/KNR4 family protein n=1 Tax=Streptomyces typhae TaxID=2681492 RepID=A0A6L6WMA6_9ACTN|nr:SMI1/KNR4 family protein [Streptomyces typhae]MVO83425.1 SMI1/KNR4 family protein [Streptomyces typhae]